MASEVPGGPETACSEGEGPRYQQCPVWEGELDAVSRPGHRGHRRWGHHAFWGNREKDAVERLEKKKSEKWPFSLLCLCRCRTSFLIADDGVSPAPGSEAPQVPAVGGLLHVGVLWPPQKEEVERATWSRSQSALGNPEHSTFLTDRIL